MENYSSVSTQVKKKAGEPGRNPVDLRLVVNAILYITRGGISWEMLPKEYGSPKTVYGYFSTWNKSGLWRDINAVLTRTR